MSIEKLIPLVMKLQDAFNVINAKNNIELPQIVVVGAQSTGKSSVLESIVGRDFLPRGSGIVTRCPLVLQLKKIADNDNSGKPNNEYGEFLHKKGEKFEDFDQIRQEIEDRTDAICGSDKGVNHTAISLTIFSPKVVDLTLVDLPGLTKVPVKGQPKDIEHQIREMAMKYISSQNSLILAMTAANTDVANSDALQIAKEVDPELERTIGVITKIDLMDEGTDCIELLQGGIYHLKLGYFGVKCRSQKQIMDGVPIRQAIENEKKFFDTHPVYSKYGDQLGFPNVTKNLNKILIRHIKKCIPNLNKQVTELLQDKEREYQKLQENAMHVDTDAGPLILGLLNQFQNTYGDIIDGRFVKDIAVECTGGSRINYIFHNVFNKVINDINPFEYLSEEDIQTAIKNSSALTPSLFVPEGAFELLVRQQISRLLEPSLDCSYQVYEELRNIVINIQLPQLTRFYKLQSKICDVMENVLDQCLTPTTEMIMNLIEIENSLINTNHPDFVGSADSLLNMFQNESEPPTDDKIFQPVTKTYSLLESKEKKEGDEDFQEISDEEQKAGDKDGDKEGGAQKVKGSSSVLGQSQINKEKKNKDKMAQDMGYDLVSQQVEESKNSFYYDKGHLPQINLPQIPHHMRADPKNDSGRVIMETRVIQNLIESYFNLVKKNIADIVPKTIIAFLVNKSRELAQSELVAQIYKSEDLENLLVEDPQVAQNRKNCKEVITALRKAQDILGEVSIYKV